MTSSLDFRHRRLGYDVLNPIDLSVPVRRQPGVNAYQLPDASFSTIEAGSFVGDVSRGGSCNCEAVTLCAHGNGTHTECVGHISRKPIYITDCLRRFVFSAHLLTIPQTDLIRPQHLEPKIEAITRSEALIIRTSPNPVRKTQTRYAGTEPTHFSAEAMQLIADADVLHLLTDLPSVDHENDPNLTAHHIFFNYPEAPRTDRTITELIYVPDSVTDGDYILHLMIAGIETDAVPSKPVLYRVLPASSEDTRS